MKRSRSHTPVQSSDPVDSCRNTKHFCSPLAWFLANTFPKRELPVPAESGMTHPFRPRSWEVLIPGSRQLRSRPRERGPHSEPDDADTCCLLAHPWLLEAPGCSQPLGLDPVTSSREPCASPVSVPSVPCRGWARFPPALREACSPRREVTTPRIREKEARREKTVCVSNTAQWGKGFCPGRPHHFPSQATDTANWGMSPFRHWRTYLKARGEGLRTEACGTA